MERTQADNVIDKDSVSDNVSDMTFDRDAARSLCKRKRERSSMDDLSFKDWTCDRKQERNLMIYIQR